MRSLTRFFRANPQAFVLFLVCLVLGLGTFLAVVIDLAMTTHGSENGDPGGSTILLLHALGLG